MAQQVEHVLGKDATCLKKDFRKIIKNTLKKGYAAMAQQVEHVLGKDEVTGSNPVSSSIKTTIYGGFFLF